MPKTSKNSEIVYELKHRITGAVILVVLAVVVIPLLLSEPTVEASNKSSADPNTTDNTFRSRIVPLNISNVNGADKSTANLTDLETTVLDDDKPALLDLTGKSNTSQTPSEPDDDKKKTTTVVMTRKTAPSDNNSTSENSSEAQSNASQIQQPENQSQQGWVVRVGTFSKNANVNSVSTLLTKSGFKPRTTAVSTSLGKSTRVWLGPYAKKQTAEKISNRLKSLIGEKGYVTRTNS